jgi:hypothetical protein
MSSSDPPVPPRRVAASWDVLHQEVEGRTVLLDLAGERYYSLNELGTRIWALLVRSGEDVEGAVRRLVADYEVDEARARRDVEEFLGRLAAAGLVRDVPA